MAEYVRLRVGVWSTSKVVQQRDGGGPSRRWGKVPPVAFLGVLLAMGLCKKSLVPVASVGWSWHCSVQTPPLSPSRVSIVVVRRRQRLRRPLLATPEGPLLPGCPGLSGADLVLVVAGMLCLEACHRNLEEEEGSM